MSPSSASKEIVSIIQEIKRAIQKSMKTPGLSVSKIDIELKTILEKGSDGKLEYKPINLNLSGKYQKQDVQTISISLIPEKEVTLYKTVDIDVELSEAIDVIREALEEAASSKPVYKLDKAQITLQFVITKEGGISVIVGASGKSEETHTITLTINSQSAT